MKNIKRLLFLKAIVVLVLFGISNTNIDNQKKEIIASDLGSMTIKKEQLASAELEENETIAYKEKEDIENKIVSEKISSQPVVKKEEKKAIENKNQTTTVATTKTSANVTKKVEEIEVIRQKKDSLGTAGRFYIPSVDVSVRIYNADVSPEGNAQKIVDNKDSAAYFQIGNQDIIADHNHQGFSKIANVKVGTKSYIKGIKGQVITYQAVNKLEGRNLGYDLVDLNGNSLLNGSGDLITYTCYKDHVMIIIWQLEK